MKISKCCKYMAAITGSGKETGHYCMECGQTCQVWELNDCYIVPKEFSGQIDFLIDSEGEELITIRKTEYEELKRKANSMDQLKEGTDKFLAGFGCLKEHSGGITISGPGQAPRLKLSVDKRKLRNKRLTSQRTGQQRISKDDRGGRKLWKGKKTKSSR